MKMHHVSRRVLNVVLVAAIAGSLGAETLFRVRDVMPDGGGVAWYGTSTVFAGHYLWPQNRPPLGVYNSEKREASGYPLVPEADYPNITCNVVENTCTSGKRALFGGLPNGTQVKFVSSGIMPGGLIAWQQDPNHVYYITEASETSFKLALNPDGPAVDLDDAVGGEGNHGLSFAGYSHVMTFLATGAAKLFTVDAETDTFTSEQPHGYTNKTVVNAQVGSGGVLPVPLTTFHHGGYTSYCAEVVDELRVRLLTSCTAGKLMDITDAGVGPLYLYLNGNPSVNISNISGYPAGTVLSWRRTNTLMGPLGYSVKASGGYGSTEQFSVTMIAKIPAITPAGDYPIRISTNESRTSNRNANFFDYTLHVVHVWEANKSGPANYPEIPGLSSSVIPGAPARYWEGMMTSSKNGGGASPGGAGTGVQHNRCVNREDPANPWGFVSPLSLVPYVLSYTPFSDSQVWFYNDETFFEIAKYTSDPTWANCGLDVARVMKDKFLKDGPSGAQGHLYFPWTLVAAYRWTGDPSYKDVVVAIADGGNNWRGTANDSGIREHAFAFERRLARREVTGEEDYSLQYYADAAIGMLYINAIPTPERTFVQPFMSGLLMRPLIRWYKISHDERVPFVIKLTLDKFWNDWYSPSRHKMKYNPEPDGPRCWVSCGNLTGTGLNNLVSPAFAWYWRLTGEDLYRERGDDLFAYNYADGNPYFAKEWSQGFYWTWDFVRWRKGEQPAY